MPLVTNEQKEKKEGQFLRAEDGDIVQLMSNLYKVVSVYVKEKKTSVAFLSEDSEAVVEGGSINKEFYYFAKVKRPDAEVSGIYKLPASCFFAMNDNEKKLKKSKRAFEWIIGKTGAGLQTKYTTVRGENVKEPTKAEMEVFNDKLSKALTAYEKNLINKYRENFGDADQWNEADVREPEDLDNALPGPDFEDTLKK